MTAPKMETFLAYMGGGVFAVLLKEGNTYRLGHAPDMERRDWERRRWESVSWEVSINVEITQ